MPNNSILLQVLFDTATKHHQIYMKFSMENNYYIDLNGTKDGPHDIVTLMRRIRAKKISSDTRLYVGNAPTAVAANTVPELKIFFNDNAAASVHDKNSPKLFTLGSVIADGKRFTLENNIMTVYSGGFILLCALLANALVHGYGYELGGLLSWIVFILLHFVYMVFTLRLSRGQTITTAYLDKQLLPIMHKLLFAAIIYGMMIAGGVILLVIPAIMVAIYYIFVPILIVDRNMSVLNAMYASRQLVGKFKGRYYSTIFFLMLAYLGSMFLIVPLPITVPIFSAAIIKIYEELSAA